MYIVYYKINDETKSNEKYIKHGKWNEYCDFD